IRGELREKPMTYRNRWHSRTVITLGYFLEDWRLQLPEPRGAVLGEEAGVRLRRNPETVVGIDLVYISPELAAHEPDDTRLIAGAPILAVEVLSPNDTQDQIDEKVETYLDAGVALVWVVHPLHQTVTIYRPGQPPTMVNNTQEL